MSATGLPIQFNWLIGSASLRDAQGNESTYNAIGVARRKGGAVSILEGATSAEIKFNDTDYDRLPQLIALDQIAPQAGGAEAIRDPDPPGRSNRVAGVPGQLGALDDLLVDAGDRPGGDRSLRLQPGRGGTGRRVRALRAGLQRGAGYRDRCHHPLPGKL